MSGLMIDQDRFSHLIGQTYDAAVGQDEWSAVLGDLLTAVGGICVALSRQGGPAAGTVTVGCDPACIELYQAHYHRIDPIGPLLPRLPSGSAFDDRMLVPGRDLERSEFYNDFLARWGMHGALSWHCQDPEGEVATLKIVRSRRHAAFGGDELRLLRGLAPHLGRALRIERGLRRRIVARPGTPAALTGRERECLRRIARGASSKSIARQLALSAHTVNEYVESAMRKLGTGNRTQAVAVALGLGLLDAEAPRRQENR